MPSHSIVLFDGECGLCVWSVQFIIQHDPRQIFRFAPLQSITGQTLLQTHSFSINYRESIVLIQQSQCFTYSTAALKIATQLCFPWPMFAAFLLVPRFLRDHAYRWIAQHRYQWFAPIACWRPTPKIQERFLEF